MILPKRVKSEAKSIEINKEIPKKILVASQKWQPIIDEFRLI